jgi:hypothetical protein
MVKTNAAIYIRTSSDGGTAGSRRSRWCEGGLQ